MKRNLIMFLGLLMICSISLAKEITISKCTTAPTIDGNGDDDWAGIAWQTVDQIKGEAVNLNNTTKFKMTYDNDYLYVLASVDDAVLDTTQSANAWEKDCIELFFAMDVNNSPAYRAGDVQLRKVFGRDLTDWVTKGYIAKEMISGTTYTQEWKLSWDSLATTCNFESTGIAAFNGKNFRFDLQNGDNDGAGRLSQLFWNANTDDQWNIVQNQGYIVLETPVDTIQGTPYITLTSTLFNIENYSTNFTVGIYSSSQWEASSDQSWLEINLTGGTGNANLIINILDDNISTISREGHITLRAGDFSRTITVIQSGIMQKSLTISKSLQAPTIDGNSEEWSNIPWVDVTEYKGDTSYLNNTTRFKMTYDDDYLYVLASVDDATLDTTQSANVWEKDCIELFFAMNTANSPQYRAGDVQLRKIFGRDMTDWATKGYIAKEMISDTTYTQEWKLSWDSLATTCNSESTGIASFDGKNFRFDLQNGDNDGAGRLSQLFWNSNADDEWNSVKNQGYIFLETPVDAIQGTPYITLTSTLLNIENYSTNYTVEIYSNSQWEASSDQSWLEINLTGGTGNADLIINVLDNSNSNISREGHITLRAGDFSRTITVIQSGNNNKNLTISKCTTAPTIDGNASDWTNVEWVNVLENKGEAANLNNTTKFKMTYDDDYLYVLASVEDAIIDTAQSVNPWEKDCIELFFAMDINNAASYRPGDLQLRKIFGRDMSDQPGKGYIAIEEQTATGFVQEWKLAWDSLTVKGAEVANFDGKQFRFELQNGDNDGAGRLSQLFWNNNTDDQWNIVQNQGYIALATPIEPTIIPPVNNNKNLTINKCAVAPTIDGNGDEDWTNVEWVNVLETRGEAANLNNTTKFKMTYDDNYLYVLASVEDAVLDTAQSVNPWEKDCIELFFAMDINNAASYRPGDLQLRKIYGRDMTDQPGKGYIAVEEQTATGFVQEWKLAWDSLTVRGTEVANFDGKQFRFELQNGDNDGAGRLSQLFWNNNTDDQWNIVQNQGYITLATPIEPTIIPPVNNNKNLTINKCAVAPTIDGNGDEDWTNVEWVNVLENKGEAVNLNNTTKFKMTYDNDYLYVLASVDDAVLDTTQSANAWEKDCIELFFAMDINNAASYRPGDLQLRKIYGRDMTDQPGKGYIAVEEQTATGFVQEWKLAWDSLTVKGAEKANFDGKQFRFELQNGDNDGFGRLSQLFWNSNVDDQWNVVQNQGFITLATPIEPTIIPPVNNNKNLTINKCAVAPTIDGNAENVWNNFTWVDVAENRGDIANKNNTTKFKMTYDDDYLYVLASVEDAILDTAQSANIWEKDCIELFFAMDTANSDTYRPGDLQLRKIFGRDMTDQAEKGYIALEQTTAAGYIQEWRMAWDSLVTKGTEKAAFNGEYFRFEIQNGDNDGAGRLSQLFWNSTADDQWSVVKNQGYVKIGREIPFKVNTPALDNSISYYPNPARDNIQIRSASNISRVDIYGLNGQLMVNRITTGNAVSINFTGIEQGVYILKVQTDKGTTSNKLLIIK